MLSISSDKSKNLIFYNKKRYFCLVNDKNIPLYGIVKLMPNKKNHFLLQKANKSNKSLNIIYCTLEDYISLL